MLCFSRREPFAASRVERTRRKPGQRTRRQDRRQRRGQRAANRSRAAGEPRHETRLRGVQHAKHRSAINFRHRGRLS